MRHTGLYLIACAIAGFLPWAASREAAPPQPFVGWPDEVAGLALDPVELRAEDHRLLEGLPGRVGRFQAEGRHVLLRWIDAPTHRVHSIRHCYRGLGYAIRPEPTAARFDAEPWSAFLAEHPSGERLRVYERVEDGDGTGYPDVSAWFWAATLGLSPPPYRVCAIVERCP